MPSEPDKPQRSKLDDLMHKAREHRERVYQEKYLNNRAGGYKYDPTKFIVYKTHISKIKSLEDPDMIYKALVMGEPEEMPADVELYVALELERIQESSKTE